MRSVIIFFLLGISINALAQTDHCNCSLNLKEVITDIETNYPGYKSKTNGDKLSFYKEIKDKASKAAALDINREDCFYIIANYLSFFKDNHIIFSDRKIIPNQPAPIKTDKKNNADEKDDLKGVWTKTADLLTINIIKQDENLYRAYILKAGNSKEKVGNVHFDLIGNSDGFKIRKFSAWLTTDLLRGRRLNQLLIEPDGIWKKIAEDAHIDNYQANVGTFNKKLVYNRLDSINYYVGIPAFDVKEKKFDSLIVNEIIPSINNSKSKHLVIDLRNNVGGNGSFLSLIRLIYDKPFSIPGDFIYASSAMIKRYQKAADDGSALHKQLLPKLIANTGDFVQRDSLKVQLKESLNYPERVSIIVNDNCASSTEYFLMIAKHSSKVTVFGRNTSGTLDYSELLQPEKLSCNGYNYLRPTIRSFYVDVNPIDNKGISPDVDLSRYPENEWIELILNWPNKK